MTAFGITKFSGHREGRLAPTRDPNPQQKRHTQGLQGVPSRSSRAVVPHCVTTTLEWRAPAGLPRDLRLRRRRMLGTILVACSPEASVIAEVSFISMRPSYDCSRATDLRTDRSKVDFRRAGEAHTEGHANAPEHMDEPQRADRESLIRANLPERSTGGRIRPGRSDLDADGQGATAGDPIAARVGNQRAAGGRCDLRMRGARLGKGPCRPSRP
jgi:hypothetical protein